MKGMKRAIVYEVSKETLDSFKIDSGELNLIYEVFGLKTRLNIIEYNKSDIFYIHLNIDGSQATDAFISPVKRFDYELVEMRTEDTITSHESKIIEKEEIEMISKLAGFRIEDVTLKDEIKGIALRVAVESIVNSGALGPDARIEKEDGKAYLVKGGDVEELTGEGFKEKASKFLIGKTLEEIEAISNNMKRKDHIMVKLIEGLDLIQGVTLKKESTGLLG